MKWCYFLYGHFLDARANIREIFSLVSWKIEDTIFPFWNFLTFIADVTELTTKIYNIKTSGFEHSNELSGVRSKIKGLENNLDAILKQFSKLREEENVQNTDLTSVKSDLTNVKTSMTSLSASLLNLKSQVASNYEMDQKVSSKLWIHYYK